MRVSVFLVLSAPVALLGGAACGSEPNKRPQGPAPVYEPWVLPSWNAPGVSSEGPNGAAALAAVLDAEATSESAPTPSAQAPDETPGGVVATPAPSTIAPTPSGSASGTAR